MHDTVSTNGRLMIAEEDNSSAGKKMYYSIREVCQQTGLEPHVLRYWESEFSQLRPKKNRAGNRAYREKDIEVIQTIRRLLYEEKFTIPGARKKLSEDKSGRSTAEPASSSTPPSYKSDPTIQQSLPLDSPQQPSPVSSAVTAQAIRELRDILAVLKD